jgi:GT2 family glycosyltransferase
MASYRQPLEQPSPSTSPQQHGQPPASIVIPTRARASYLEVALASIAPQARATGAEVLIVDDAGPTSAGRALAQRFDVRYEPHERPLGLNVARNTGVERSRGELVVFVDDDIAAAPGWLQALLDAAREHPDVDVFAGAIRARLEGPGWWASRSCGRESPPITTLQLGPHDTDTRYAWGSNMTIRRSALNRIGPFEETLADGGDEQEWQERLRARDPDARVLYVAGACVDHRRAGDDARLRALARAQYVRGRAARRFDATRGTAPSKTGELATLAGCGWHVIRRGCPAGLTMVAHSAGRLREAFVDEQPRPHEGSDDFLSGHSGTVGGVDRALRQLRDATIDAWEIASTKRLRLDRAARHAPARRRVLAIGVVRPEHAHRAQRIRAELMRSRHEVELLTCAPDGLGKFENLNRLLAERLPRAQAAVAVHTNCVPIASEPILEGVDWLLVIDDDVELPRGFLDRLLFLSEHFSLQLAQPAHRLDSHAAWEVTRRRPGSVVRETAFVEIGPVTAMASETFVQLLPFPQLRMGWGLDAHWAALARQHGWRCGVLDAVAIGHRAAPAAEAYSREAAIAEARAYLAERPYLPARELQRTSTTHRHW